MNAICTVCGQRFDHSVEGIDWQNKKFLCWPCNDRGYDLTARGEITQPQQASRQARELAILQETTRAINAGMASPFNWTLVALGLIGMPFTGGLSFGLTIVGGIRMSGSPLNIVAGALPMSVDAIAPKAGCARVIAALGSIVFILFAIGLLAIMAMVAMGVR